MAVRLIEIDFDTNAPEVQKQIDSLKDELAATTKTTEEAEKANEEYSKSLKENIQDTDIDRLKALGSTRHVLLSTLANYLDNHKGKSV